MRAVIGSMLVFAMVTAAAPAHSGEAAHVFRCEQDDDATEEELMALSQQWLAAARQTKGGEGLQVQMLFPVAVNSSSEIDFLFRISAPSLEQWGVFWDNYHESPVGDVDDLMRTKMVCPESMLWEVERVAVGSQ